MHSGTKWVILILADFRPMGLFLYWSGLFIQIHLAFFWAVLKIQVSGSYFCKKPMCNLKGKRFQNWVRNHTTLYLFEVASLKFHKSNRFSLLYVKIRLWWKKAHLDWSFLPVGTLWTIIENYIWKMIFFTLFLLSMKINKTLLMDEFWFLKCYWLQKPWWFLPILHIFWQFIGWKLDFDFFMNQP